MEAMIFAAGLGTRLKPLTDQCPKALIKLQGKTLLEHNIELLINIGVNHIVINVHHFAPMMKEFIMGLNYPGVRFSISDESEKLLDTGGGLKKAHSLFQSKTPVIVVNVDIISNVNLAEIYAYHIEKNALATLAIRNRESSRYLLFDNNMQLAGWQNLKTNETILTSNQTYGLKQFAFSGIQIISSGFFDLLPEKDIFSIIEVYLALAGNKNINGFVHNNGFWYDIGSVQKLEYAKKNLGLPTY
jgi:N-acetyl-alpha-D-muramate 1-phosphate uridylyltransferase